MSGGLCLEKRVLTISITIFLFLALWFAHSCGGSNSRKVKPKPEFSASVPSALAGGQELVGFGFDYKDEFGLRIQFPFFFSDNRTEDIDLKFDCWLAKQPKSFGVSQSSTPPFVTRCDPIAVPRYLDGLRVMLGNRGDNSGLGAFVRRFENNDEIKFTYPPENILSLEEHSVDGRMAISKPTEQTGLPIVTAVAVPLNSEGKRRGMSIYVAYVFTPDDISKILITLERK